MGQTERLPGVVRPDLSLPCLQDVLITATSSATPHKLYPTGWYQDDTVGGGREGKGGRDAGSLNGAGMVNYQGGGASNRARKCQVVEAPWPLALTRKRPPDRENKRQNILGEEKTHREVNAETQGIMRSPQQKNPPGANMELGAGQGMQSGGKRTWEKVADVGTWCGTQRPVMEAGGWRVWETSRWMMLHARRGGGEWVV